MENKEINREKILEVKNLSQYFKSSNQKELKAVDHISFDVYQGEVFGIVGESGCGKTTTGRSIIKLYDITTGEVYFKGVKISAGIRDFKDKIKKIKKEYAQEVVSIKKECKIKQSQDENKAREIFDEYHQELISIPRKFSLKGIAKRIKITSAKNKALKMLNKIDNAKYHEIKKQLDEVLANKAVKRKEQIVVEYQKIKEANETNKNYEKVYQNQQGTNERLMSKMQMIFQDPISSLDPRMTVRDIIAEGIKVIGIKDQEEINKRVYDVLTKVGLVHEHANRYPHEFSGGQRQRIGIARSIVMSPELIIADEPVSALDVSIQAQVINILNELRKKMNLTIIFIAHDLSVVKYFSDRIAVMYYGKIVELTSSKELFEHPLHPYTKSLLSAIPLPDPRYERLRKRVSYNPLISHDYTKDKPVLREIKTGHFVSCNDAEYEKYKEELK